MLLVLIKMTYHSFPDVSRFFTARKRSCGKLIFLHLSVSDSVHGGGMRGWGTCVAGDVRGRGRAWRGRGGEVHACRRDAH